MVRQILIVNKSTLLKTSKEVGQVYRALTTQLKRDFNPRWNTNIEIYIVKEADIKPTDEVLFLLDTSDVADALGYHDINDKFKAVGFSFIKTSLAAGDSWSSTTSHELLEMISDPQVNLIAEFDYNLGSSKSIPACMAYENCDPVENDEYIINSIKVSNFVFPEYFIKSTSKSQYDHMNTLKAPFTLSKGGYYAYFTEFGKWRQQFAKSTPRHQRSIKSYSRRYRRVLKHILRGSHDSDYNLPTSSDRADTTHS
jgi:hypothetical protein